MKIIIKRIVLALLPFSINIVQAQNNCEQISTISIEKLVPALQKNDVSTILTILNTMEASCGENEFTLRTRLIYQLINKENIDAVYSKYINHRRDEELIFRWDNAAESDYQYRYSKNKKKFNNIPLRHPTDSLLKVKSLALLNSPSYTSLNDQEVAILQLFTDDIDSYLDWRETKQVVETKSKQRDTYTSHQTKHTFGIHTGIFMPIEDNFYFGNSFMGGLSIMSAFTNDFVFDVHYKFRVHSKMPAIDFVYKEDIRAVEPNSSHVLSIGTGYKLLNKNRFIILPKLNLGYGIIWTGLSETVYGEDDEGNETETRLPKNVQTLHSTFGIAIMRHISNKTYIGVESNIHLIPYKWDSKLKSSIPSKYASLEFFVRF
jgi:hypothetical protein